MDSRRCKREGELGDVGLMFALQLSFKFVDTSSLNTLKQVAGNTVLELKERLTTPTTILYLP